MCRREGDGRRKREKEINKAKMNLQELQQGCNSRKGSRKFKQERIQPSV